MEDPYEYLNAAAKNSSKKFNSVVSYIEEHSANNENLGNTLMVYYMDKLANLFFKLADDVFDPDYGPKVLISSVLIPWLKDDYGLDDNSVTIILINLIQNKTVYSQEHHVDTSSEKFKQIYSVIEQVLIEHLIKDAAEYEDISALKKHYTEIYNMAPSNFYSFLYKIFRYLRSPNQDSPYSEIVFPKVREFYQEKVIDALKSRRHPIEFLKWPASDVEDINYIVDSTFKFLSQKLLEIFNIKRAETGEGDFPASLDEFQTTYGPFNKKIIRAVLIGASPIYASYISGERLAAGKTLITPGGNINISNFPRNRPNSAFAAHALRAFLPDYGARQHQGRVYSNIAARIRQNEAHNVLPEDVNYRELAANNLSYQAANRMMQIAEAKSDPEFAHSAGYEPPINIGNYAQVATVARKPALKSKPANKSRKLRFNNAATQVKMIERYEGGALRQKTSKIAHFLPLRSHNNRRPTRRNRG